MTILDFYEILKRAVQHFPAGAKQYDQINTFAIIRSLQDLSTDNLSKSPDYIDSNYYYARKQKRSKNKHVIFDYPALVILPANGQARFPFSKNESTYCHNILLSIVYPNYEKTGNCKDCEKLKIEDLYTKMEAHLRHLMAYIADVRVYNNGADLHYFSEKHLLAQQAAGNFLSATENTTQTNKYHKSMIQNNGNFEIGFHDDMGIDKLCGVEVQLTFCECFAPSYSVSLDNTDCCG